MHIEDKRAVRDSGSLSRSNSEEQLESASVSHGRLFKKESSNSPSKISDVREKSLPSACKRKADETNYETPTKRRRSEKSPESPSYEQKPLPFPRLPPAAKKALNFMDKFADENEEDLSFEESNFHASSDNDGMNSYALQTKETKTLESKPNEIQSLVLEVSENRFPEVKIDPNDNGIGTPITAKAKLPFTAKAKLPSIILLERSSAFPTDEDLAGTSGFKPSSFMGVDYVLMNHEMSEIFLELVGFAEGKDQRVFAVKNKVNGMNVVFKIFKSSRPADIDRLSQEILLAYRHLCKRTDISVPKLLNNVYKDGYFIWERISGTHAQLDDVKKMLVKMFENFNEKFLADFRPDNVMKKEDGTLVVVDPSWNSTFASGVLVQDAKSLQIELAHLIEAWVCPYKQPKIDEASYKAFMAELDKVKMQPEVQDVWESVKKQVEETFNSKP